MKDFFQANYTFTPGGSGVGTVNLFGIRNFDISRLVSIINQTKGEVIYATGAAATRYTNVSNTTVTLFYNTSAHSSADVLQIVYNYDNVKSVHPADNDLGILVREIQEDNAYTQEILNAMLALLRSAWGIGAAANAYGSLNIRSPAAADTLVTATISGTPAANITQIAGATTGSTTGLTAPSTAGTNLVVAPTIAYHLPVLPQHIYGNVGV
jgi:hypothetical protein